MQTIKFGTHEFPLSAAVSIGGSMATIQITPSSTVTGEAVYSAVKDAGSFTISDGTNSTEYANYKFVGSVGVSDVLTVTMQKLNDSEIQIKTMAAIIESQKISIGILESATQYGINELGE